jgi:hypothetical protein
MTYIKILPLTLTFDLVTSVGVCIMPFNKCIASWKLKIAQVIANIEGVEWGLYK